MEEATVQPCSEIIAVVDDLFFASKIRATAGHLGVTVRFVRNSASALEAIKRAAPRLVIVDLNSKAADPFALAGELKASHSAAQTRLVGFCSHVQTAVIQEAVRAGYDSVLPRSAFTRDLESILKSPE